MIPSHDEKADGSQNRLLLVGAVIRQLAACRDVLEALTENQYQKKIPFRSNPQRIKGSVGEHVRHLIEFVQNVTFTDSLPAVIDYDARKRDLAIQENILHAQSTIEALLKKLQGLTEHDLEKEVSILEAVDEERDDIPRKSTLGREILFIVSHTEHHFNTILERCDEMGVLLPSNFGMATSTLRHLKKS